MVMEEENSMKEHLLLQKKAEEGDGGGDGGAPTLVLIFSIFVSVCGSFVSGCAMGYTSPVQSEIVADLALSTADFSLFGSMLTVGGLLGSLLCGRMTDYLGRRYTMALSDILGITGWLAIAFSKDAWSLDLGRLALGLAVGHTVYVVPVYIAEITPKNLRGGSVLLHQFMSSCGIALAYIVGLATTWRTLALIGAIPCIVQFLGLFFIPESPRWLVKIGRDGDYVAALQSLRGKNVDISSEATDMKEYTKAVENISEDNLFKVFRMKYAYALTVSLGLMALASFGGTNGFLFYAANTFESAGVPVVVGTIAMALIQLPPIFLGVFLMDNFGRRPLLLISVSGMGTACLFVALSFLMKLWLCLAGYPQALISAGWTMGVGCIRFWVYVSLAAFASLMSTVSGVQEHGWLTHFSPYLALIGVLMFSAAFPVGMGGIPFLIMSEIFPINIKGAAGSLATIVSWSTAWIVSYSFNFMMDWSSSGTFFIFTGINIFSVLFVAKLVPETKGQTLEEIQEAISQTPY